MENLETSETVDSRSEISHSWKHTLDYIGLLAAPVWRIPTCEKVWSFKWENRKITLWTCPISQKDEKITEIARIFAKNPPGFWQKWARMNKLIPRVPSEKLDSVISEMKPKRQNGERTALQEAAVDGSIVEFTWEEDNQVEVTTAR